MKYSVVLNALEADPTSDRYQGSKGTSQWSAAAPRMIRTTLMRQGVRSLAKQFSCSGSAGGTSECPSRGPGKLGSSRHWDLSRVWEVLDVSLPSAAP